jgi:hypothetical protein
MIFILFLLFAAVFWIDIQRFQFAIEVGSLHANDLRQFTDIAPNLPEMVEEVVSLELIPCVSQGLIIVGKWFT